MNKEQRFYDLMNSKDIRCTTNSKDVIFIKDYLKNLDKDDKNYCDGINLIINSEDVQDDISQLYCILKCGCHKNLADFYSENYFYDNLEQFMEIAEEQIEEKPIEINYYWYHHGMPSIDKEKIQKAIDEKDFDTFINFYKKYNSEGIKKGIFIKDLNSFCPIVYLPDTATWVAKDNVVHWLDILNKDNFNRITFSENECG